VQERDNDGRGCGEVNRVVKEGVCCAEYRIEKEGVQGSEKSGEGRGGVRSCG
jgi:hypothetical protein